MRSRARSGSTELISSPKIDFTSSAMRVTSCRGGTCRLFDAGFGRDLVELVAGGQEHDCGLVDLGLFERHLRVGTDDDLVAEGSPARGGAIETDDAGARRTLDHVGREALAVVDVVDLDVLVRQQAGRSDEIRIDL